LVPLEPGGGPVIHHVVLEVSDLERSGAFYDSVLAPLGWWRHVDQNGSIGWGIAKPVFFVTGGRTARPGSSHVCFPALGIAAVKAAWEAGLRAGGINEGYPGAEPSHASGSYSAYLSDPDGHRIEITVATEWRDRAG
jgi:catechol 2,3-dioxygenase-like lactoylglutathione lyase family enzyme